MNLYIYNTLSQKKEIFKPILPGRASMYVCGPTVYDAPHIGNGRSVVVYDLLFRVLRLLYGEHNVVYIRNITDVDDKIIDRAKELNVDIKFVTNSITNIFHENTNYLGCLSPSFEPRATDNIQTMIELIEKLIHHGYAYISHKHVYFSVEKYKDYSRLSNRVLTEMFSNVRIDDSPGKEFFADFVLWKPAESEEKPDTIFDSPWGKGRPGWHIECSAMSYRYLGKDFDIHGGGADLIFPHHTNEIAQSKCAFPGSHHASYWVHNGFLTVNSEKMSKSLGNFVTIKDLQQKGISGEVIRLMFLNTHYRKPINFNDKALHDAKLLLNDLYCAIELANIKNNLIDPQNDYSEVNDFFYSLMDDLNSHKAIFYLLNLAKAINSENNDRKRQKLGINLLYLSNFLGILNTPLDQWFETKLSKEQILLMIDKRQQAKQDKNWILADQIRAELAQSGIQLHDNADGNTSWRRK